MGRRPTLRNKRGYWFSESGGTPRYFGRCDEVTRTEAMARLWTALAGLADEPEPEPPRITTEELRDRFLEWVGRHRSAKTALERARHLARFVEFFAGKPAERIDSTALERFATSLFRRGYAADYVAKHLTSVRALYRRGVKLGWIRPTDPFARFESIKIPPKVLRESDLPTREEIERLFRRAKGVVLDLLTLYHATGARTHEILEVRVDDFQRGPRCLVLARHKRSNTLRDPIPRTIHLNDDAHEVLERRCDGRSPDELIITNDRGKPYVSSAVNGRFVNLRRAAGVRDHITPYSFRHLFITDCLQAGVDAAVVAKMAGTSSAVIEKTYAHWRSEVFRDAQARLDAMRGR